VVSRLHWAILPGESSREIFLSVSDSENAHAGEIRGTWLRPGPIRQGRREGARHPTGFKCQVRRGEAAAILVLDRCYADFREFLF
jgi:hypothetical protein